MLPKRISTDAWLGPAGGMGTRRRAQGPRTLRKLVRVLPRVVVALVGTVVVGYIGMQKYFDWLISDAGRVGHDSEKSGPDSPRT